MEDLRERVVQAHQKAALVAGAMAGSLARGRLRSSDIVAWAKDLKQAAEMLEGDSKT